MAKADLYDAKNIPKVVITLVALGESVSQTCPTFKGPYLDMSCFSWSTTSIVNNSHYGGSIKNAVNGRSRQRRTGGVHVQGNGVTSFLQPRAGITVGCSSGDIARKDNSRCNGYGVNSIRSNVWTRGIGNSEIIMSPGESDDDDDEDFDASAGMIDRGDSFEDGSQQDMLEMEEMTNEDLGVGGLRRGSMTATGDLQALLTVRPSCSGGGDVPSLE